MAHSSHKTRISDSSLYDEVCIYCLGTDARNDERLNRPCPQVPKEPSQEKEKNESEKPYAGE